jgi:hypothetical protein
MITLFKNQKPNKMSKSKELFMEQREAEIQREQFQSSKEIFGNTEKSINKITENYRNILIATDSICKERKVKNG